MNTITIIFIMLQIILFFFMALHDWVHLPPLTDIRALEKHSTKKGRLINSIILGLLILVPLFLTWRYQNNFPSWVLITLTVVYGLLTLGTIFAWWVPYIFGSSKEHKEGFAEYLDTHHFLPKRDDNVVPNTFHVILHLQIWLCLAIAIYLLVRPLHS